jgi:hypothetical protein
VLAILRCVAEAKRMRCRMTTLSVAVDMCSATLQQHSTPLVHFQHPEFAASETEWHESVRVSDSLLPYYAAIASLRLHRYATQNRD